MATRSRSSSTVRCATTSPSATTGQQHAVASITLTNRAPTAGQPPIVIASPSPAVPTGANRSIVSFYTYLRLDHATVQGQPFRLTAQTERGLNVYTTALTIPSGVTAQLRLDLWRGRFGRDHGKPGIRLTVGHQVMVNADRVNVQIRGQRASRSSPSRRCMPPTRSTATWSAMLEQRTVLQATLGR